MSKQIKQMEMDALAQTFQDVRDMVMLSVKGLNAVQENQIRLGLRKKGIRLKLVKNSLVSRVFTQLGMKLPGRHAEQNGKKVKTRGYWEGPTTVAWGAGSLAELSKELDAIQKKNDKT